MSTYTPDEKVPGYRRLKVNPEQFTKYSGEQFRNYSAFIRGQCDFCDCDIKVLVQGSCRYRDICYDTDIVEIGSRAILKQAALAIRDDMSMEPDEIRRRETGNAEMKRLIVGAIHRHLGEQTEDTEQFTRKNWNRFKPTLFRPTVQKIHRESDHSRRVNVRNRRGRY